MATKARKGRSSAQLANHEVVVLAAYLVGGRFRRVDTEDVAVKASEIAPGRFTWRKYRDQINMEHVRVFLSVAKKPKYGAYLIGSGNEGWLLTEAGVDFAQRHVGTLNNMDLSRVRLKAKEKVWAARERHRMLASEAYRKFADGCLNTVTAQEAERFFRLDEYVVGKARQARLQRVINFFGDDPDLGSAIQALAEMVRGR